MLALMAESSVVQVVGGALILLFPFVGMVVIYANEELYKRRHMQVHRRREIQVAIIFAMGALSFLLPWTWVLTVTGIMIARRLLFLWDRRRGRVTDRPAELARSEWLQTEPDDTLCYELWRQIKVKVAERDDLARGGRADLATLAEIQRSVDALVDTYNERVERIRSATFSQGAALASIAGSFVIILAVNFLGNDNPWIPAEQIDLKGGNREIAYVLSSSDKWTSILREKNRDIAKIPSDEIAGRKICSASKRDEVNTETIWRLKSGKVAVYKKCPSPRIR
ncbi:hypothetical protein [Streptomyces goshikiensis]|uniref:hypothetical protein n=1 Tax=Streptomyces goshikiensis TaxID=1942 RepID=UPI0036DEBAE3